MRILPSNLDLLPENIICKINTKAVGQLPDGKYRITRISLISSVVDNLKNGEIAINKTSTVLVRNRLYTVIGAQVLPHLYLINTQLTPFYSRISLFSLMRKNPLGVFSINHFLMSDRMKEALLTTDDEILLFDPKFYRSLSHNHKNDLSAFGYKPIGPRRNISMALLLAQLVSCGVMNFYLLPYILTRYFQITQVKGDQRYSLPSRPLNKQQYDHLCGQILYILMINE